MGDQSDIDIKGLQKSDIKTFLLRMDPELVQKVDARAAEKGISRNEWFSRMTQWVLTNKP